MDLFQIQRIELEKKDNTRDLGGFIMMDGRKIQPGRLIRSGDLYHLRENEACILLNDYSLKTVVDFRRDVERVQRPDSILPGVVYHWVPVLDEAMPGVTKEKGSDQNAMDMLISGIKTGKDSTEQFMHRMYENILSNSHVANAYRTFFDILLAQEEGAVLWHCSIGKDRAGIASMLLLLALGASRELVIADYLKTNEFVKDNANAYYERTLKKTGDETLSKDLLGIFLVKQSYADHSFATMTKLCGSVEAYLEQRIGLTPKKCEKLRNMYLE